MATPVQDLVSAPAQANIAAAPDIERLAQLVSEINQKAYLSAPGRQQELGNIQNMMAGNLAPETIAEAQRNAAQQYGGAGFGVDSGAWQSAIARAIGLDRQALQERGASALNAMYGGMPAVNAQQYTISPDLYATYQHNRAMEQQAAAALREESRQFDISTERGRDEFTRTLQQRQAEAMQAANQANKDLAEKQREFDLTHSATVANQIAQLQENARQANMDAALRTSALNQAQAQFTAGQAQQSSQFQQTLRQQQNEFEAAQKLNQDKLYASLYGTLPGYNQYGQYTGQIGGIPTYDPTAEWNRLATQQSQLQQGVSGGGIPDYSRLVQQAINMSPKPGVFQGANAMSSYNDFMNQQQAAFQKNLNMLTAPYRMA